MKKLEIENRLYVLQEALSKFNAEVDRVATVIPNIFETTVYDSVGLIIDDYINSVADVIGIESEVLVWWVYDCDFGNKPRECVMQDGTKILCDSITSFMKTLDIKFEDQ